MNNDLIRSLLVLADVVEARDPYTGGHVWRVSQFAKLLAIKSGLSEKEAVQVSLGGYLHDLGKVGIPDDILRKEGRLTEDEYAIMKTHPIIGEKLIAAHPLSALVRRPILEHHERLNGNGYPRGLSKKEIAFSSQIIGVVDMLDALTSARPYRRELPLSTAFEIMNKGKGTDFAPSLLEHLEVLGEEGDLSHIIGHSASGIPMLECAACGPVIAVPKTPRTGDTVFCRACGGKFILHQLEDSFESENVGEAVSQLELQAETNTAAIDELMKEFAGKF